MSEADFHGYMFGEDEGWAPIRPKLLGFPEHIQLEVAYRELLRNLLAGPGAKPRNHPDAIIVLAHDCGRCHNLLRPKATHGPDRTCPVCGCRLFQESLALAASDVGWQPVSGGTIPPVTVDDSYMADLLFHRYQKTGWRRPPEPAPAQRIRIPTTIAYTGTLHAVALTPALYLPETMPAHHRRRAEEQANAALLLAYQPCRCNRVFRRELAPDGVWPNCQHDMKSTPRPEVASQYDWKPQVSA